MWHQIFRIHFSESFSTTTSMDRHLWFTYLIEISYSQPRSMRSPAVMSSAPCRWRPRCITAYPSLVRPGPNERCNRWNLQDPHCQGTDVGMRCENAGDQAHHWCHKTPRCTFHTCWPRCHTSTSLMKSSEFEISYFKTRHQRRASVVSKNIHIKPRLWHSFSMASGCCECQSCSHLFLCPSCVTSESSVCTSKWVSSPP